MSKERHPSRTSRTSVGSGQYDPVAGEWTLKVTLRLPNDVYTLDLCEG